MYSFTETLRCLCLASEKFVLASGSNLSLANGLASWKVSLEPWTELQNDWRFSLEWVSYNTITHLNFFWIIMPHFLLGMGRCYRSYMLKSMKQTSLSLSNCFKNSNVIFSWSVSLDWCDFFSTKSIDLYLHSLLPGISKGLAEPDSQLPSALNRNKLTKLWYNKKQ